MKPLNNKIAIYPDLEHKCSATLPNGQVLVIVKDFGDIMPKIKEGSRDWEMMDYEDPGEIKENLREKNPQEGIVAIDDERLGLKKGDRVIVQHFQFIDHSGNLAENVIEINGELIAFVPDYEIYCKVVEDTLVPTGEFLICNEIPVQLTEIVPCINTPEVSASTLGEFEIPMKEIEVEIEAVNEKNTLGLKKGDIVILIERYCKYPVEIRGKKFVRVRESEVVATVE